MFAEFHTPRDPRARPLADGRGVGKPSGRFPHASLSFSSPGAAVLFFLKEEKEKNGGAKKMGGQWPPLQATFGRSEEVIGNSE